MRINVAFCFDENLMRQVRVTVAALLDARTDKTTHYDIYCVCTKEAAEAQTYLDDIVKKRDPESELYFIDIKNAYEKAYEVRGISSGAYLRLELPRLLPKVDKILYLDIDTFVRGGLESLWQIEMKDYLLAGVKAAVNITDKWEWNSDRPYWGMLKDMKGKYVNSGVLLMNLAKMRERRMECQWNELAKIRMYYQDQDILNITCQGAIYHLPPEYNRFAYFPDEEYRQFVEEGMYTQEECEKAIHRPTIIHYAGDKPWKRYDGNLCSLWWDYVNSQQDLKGLFDEAKARRYHGPTFWEKVVRRIKKMLSKEKL
jgi:UDP-glucose:(galactosyl)LPS alpha-1,2-glucosyltransferase